MLTSHSTPTHNNQEQDDLPLLTFSSSHSLWQKKHWLIGVSGGPDSMALWHAAIQHAPSQGIQVSAVTIDHGLRPAARIEAETLALFAQQRDWAHYIAQWEGDKPTTRLQERARTARYQLIIDLAHRIGADALLTAHHADDQMETILFRLSRGSGPAGLAGMAAHSIKSGLDHYRPLLERRKADLIHYCQVNELPVFNDPSNNDPRFARAQARALLPNFEKAGMAADSWLRLGRRAARAEQALASLAHNTITALPATITASGYHLPYDAFMGLPNELKIRLITQEIQRINKNQGNPRLEQCEHLIDELTQPLAQGLTASHTLAQCLISLNLKKGFSITRAPERRIQA